MPAIKNMKPAFRALRKAYAKNDGSLDAYLCIATVQLQARGKITEDVMYSMRQHISTLLGDYLAVSDWLADRRPKLWEKLKREQGYNIRGYRLAWLDNIITNLPGR